jgi:hypothetical protein
VLFEVIILLELIAFAFLALGIMPTQSNASLTGEKSKVPYMNKVIFIMVAMIIFFVLGISSSQYKYTYCYINETYADWEINSTVSTATCDYYLIESTDVSYLNYGLAMLCLLVSITLIIFAGMSKFEGM